MAESAGGGAPEREWPESRVRDAYVWGHMDATGKSWKSWERRQREAESAWEKARRFLLTIPTPES